jgi:hypothetical protein
MKHNLISEVYDELDMIQALAKLTNTALTHDSKEASEDYIKLVFEDIEKRYQKIYELLRQVESNFGCSNK